MLCRRPTVVTIFVLASTMCLFGVAARADDAGKADDKLPRKDAYLYDGKTFEAWRRFALTELRVDKRIVALTAMKAFGAGGYDKEAAAVVMQVVEDHLREFDNEAHDPPQSVVSLTVSLSAGRGTARKGSRACGCRSF